jgi:hypothetical protein
LRHWCEQHNAWADTAPQPRAATESRVTIPHSIQRFWLKFQAIVRGDVLARFYEAFHFGLTSRNSKIMGVIPIEFGYCLAC